MLCQSHLHTASETFVCHKKNKKNRSGSVFASVASILIGMDDKCENPPGKMHLKISYTVCKDLNAKIHLMTFSPIFGFDYSLNESTLLASASFIFCNHLQSWLVRDAFLKM